MFGNVVKALCVCGCVLGSICEETQGMETLEKYSGTKRAVCHSVESNVYRFAPICVDFPFFLGYCKRNRNAWPSALQNIRQNLEMLQLDEYCSDLQYARLAIQKLSGQYAFREAVEFCKTDECDQFCRETLTLLLQIIPRVLSSLHENGTEEHENDLSVACEVKEMVHSIKNDNGSPLLTYELMPLFLKVNHLNWF